MLIKLHVGTVRFIHLYEPQNAETLKASDLRHCHSRRCRHAGDMHPALQHFHKIALMDNLFTSPRPSQGEAQSILSKQFTCHVFSSSLCSRSSPLYTVSRLRNGKFICNFVVAVVLLDTTGEEKLEWTRYPYGPQANTPGVSFYSIDNIQSSGNNLYNQSIRGCL